MKFKSAFCFLESYEVHLLTITDFSGTSTDEMALAINKDYVKNNCDLHAYELTNLPFTTNN